MRIEKEHSFYGTITLLLLIWLVYFVPLTLAKPFLDGVDKLELNIIFLTIGIVTTIYLLSSYIVKKILIYNRKKKITAFATSQHLPQMPTPKNQDITPFSSLALSDMHNITNYKSTNHVYHKDWTYGEIKYDVERRTKNSEYVAYTVHYAAMTTKLPRELPNVFFDSKKARGKQFRFHFDGSQKHSLEGSFDDYFITYFPERYTIDSLSFITPDVMHVLIDACQYDIEIKKNTVTIFGSLKNPQRQIPEMEKLLMAIKKQLLDNIITYRDDRLPTGQGRKTVTPHAMTLKRSKFWTYVSIGGTVIYVCIYIYEAFYGS